MSFPDAVKACLSKYATFTGRARRSEYWWYTLFAALVYLVGSTLDAIANTNFIALVFAVALILPSLAVTARRLHDTDRSGWWILISLVPFGGIVLLVFTVQDSHPDNAYGPSPKYNTPAYGVAPA